MARPKKEPVAPTVEVPALGTVSDTEAVTHDENLSTSDGAEKFISVDTPTDKDAAFQTVFENLKKLDDQTIINLAQNIILNPEGFEQTSGDLAHKLSGIVTAKAALVRDERGLLRGVTYHFLPNGNVDWRKMIDPKYIVFREEKKDEIEKTYGKSLTELSTDEVDDKYLLLLLGGIKDLLKLRGFFEVDYTALPGCTSEFVSMKCRIDFRPNFETGFVSESFSDWADATPDNVEGWYARYLTTAASNRSLVRAVRNYLGIYIVGKDEVGPGSKAEASSTQTKAGVDGFGPYAMLADLLKKRERDFVALKKFLVSKNYFTEHDIDPETWLKLEDIPKDQVFKIVGLIKKAG